MQVHSQTPAAVETACALHVVPRRVFQVRDFPVQPVPTHSVHNDGKVLLLSFRKFLVLECNHADIRGIVQPDTAGVPVLLLRVVSTVIAGKEGQRVLFFQILSADLHRLRKIPGRLSKLCFHVLREQGRQADNIGKSGLLQLHGDVHTIPYSGSVRCLQIRVAQCEVPGQSQRREADGFRKVQGVGILEFSLIPHDVEEHGDERGFADVIHAELRVREALHDTVFIRPRHLLRERFRNIRKRTHDRSGGRVDFHAVIGGITFLAVTFLCGFLREGVPQQFNRFQPGERLRRLRLRGAEPLVQNAVHGKTGGGKVAEGVRQDGFFLPPVHGIAVCRQRGSGQRQGHTEQDSQCNDSFPQVFPKPVTGRFLLDRASPPEIRKR